MLVDQVRTIDTDHIYDLVHYCTRDQMMEVEHAVAFYLGLHLNPPRTGATPS